VEGRHARLLALMQTPGVQPEHTEAAEQAEQQRQQRAQRQQQRGQKQGEYGPREQQRQNHVALGNQEPRPQQRVETSNGLSPSPSGPVVVVGAEHDVTVGRGVTRNFKGVYTSPRLESPRRNHRSNVTMRPEAEKVSPRSPAYDSTPASPVQRVVVSKASSPNSPDRPRPTRAQRSAFTSHATVGGSGRRDRTTQRSHEEGTSTQTDSGGNGSSCHEMAARVLSLLQHEQLTHPKLEIMRMDLSLDGAEDGAVEGAVAEEKEEALGDTWGDLVSALSCRSGLLRRTA